MPQNPVYTNMPILMPRILALLSLLAVLALVYPFTKTIFMAGCISCLLLPLYRYFRARFSRIISVAFLCLAMCAAIFLPLAVVSVLVVPQAVSGLRTLEQWRASGWQLPPEFSLRLQEMEEWLRGIPFVNTWMNELSENVDAVLQTFGKTLVTGSLGFAGGAVSVFWVIFLCLFLSVLGVVYAPLLKKVTLRVTLLPEDSLDRFIRSIRQALVAVVAGVLLVALVQGTLCGIGYKITGISEPAFWALLSTFAAIIPMVGTALIWGPLALSLWVGDSAGAALGLVAWGTFVVAGADNFIRPYFLSTGIAAPMFVLLFSILCGMSVFGPIGLILGPVAVAFSIQAMRESDILLERRQQAQCPVNTNSTKASAT